VETIGYSAEARPIKVAKIKGSRKNASEKAIWIDGGKHFFHAPNNTTQHCRSY
jgi:hypothetical protein